MRRLTVVNAVVVGLAMLAVACGPQESGRTRSGAGSPPTAATPTSASPSVDPSAEPSVEPAMSPSASPSSAPEPTESPSPSPTGTPTSGTEALAAAEKLWKSKSLSSYSFTYDPRCFCPRTKLLVTVGHGAVTAVKPLPGQDKSGGSYVPTLAEAPSVEKLFAQLHKAYEGAKPAAAVQVAYDADSGFPTSAYIDWDTLSADEETGYGVGKLSAAPATSQSTNGSPKPTR